MAIADTISSMYDNVGEVYDTITNVDLPTNKNIENIPSTMRSSYLEIMNNGIDKIWNNWEKVTGEGETLTLNSTEEAPMKINLKGNTSQASYGGKNLIPTQTDLWEQGAITGNTGEDSRSTARLRTKEYYPISNDTDYYVSIQNSNYCFLNIILYDSNKGYIGQYYNISSDINGTRRKLINVPSALMPNVVYYRATVRNTNNTATITASEIEIAKPQIELGSTATNWEQYVGGVPSPNPDYPQNIHVVSGDNSINVCGKNILKLPDNIRTFNGGVNVETSNNTKFTFTGTSSAAYYNSFALNYHLPKGTYTMSSTNNNFKYYFWFRDKINVTTYANVHLNNSSRTFILEEDAETIIVGVEGLTSGTTYNIETYFQLEKGDSATSYEPFNSDTYNVSLPIKNLFDSSLFTNRTVQGITLTKNSDGTITLNGTSTARADFTIIDSFSLKGDNKIASIFKKGGTTTGNVTFGIYDSNWANGKQCNITSSSDIGNASLPSEITLTKCFIRIESGITLSNLTIALQIEQGTETNSYTPFGTTPIELCKIGYYQDSIVKDNGKWYLNKQIGKVVFDGSENWILDNPSSQGIKQFTLVKSGVFYTNSSEIHIFSNYFKGVGWHNSWLYDNVITTGSYANTSRIRVMASAFSTVNDFKIWLSTHNTEVYYVLATPTYTEITDSTLISQLEALNGAKSYTNQTNISQENNDLPFILDATALKQLTQEEI